MSLFGNLNKKITDPLGFINKIGDKWGMQDVTDLYREGPIGNASGIKQAAGSKGGSLLSGRAILQGGPREQNMESARTFDVFGSPATAGTNQQTTARSLAALYGAYMGAGALGGGSGGANPYTSSNPVDVASGPTSGGAAGSSPWWRQLAGQSPPQMRQQQPYQPQWEMLDDGTQKIDPQLLARLLREYR